MLGRILLGMGKCTDQNPSQLLIFRPYCVIISLVLTTFDTTNVKVQDMKLNNIHGFSSIDDYVIDKLKRYGEQPHTMENLYRAMFEETDNIIWETTEGYRIRKTTYGEALNRVESTAPAIKAMLDGIPVGSLVGLYAANSPEWIVLFWSVLRCGYPILLMNTRLPDGVLETALSEHAVAAVLSDGKTFGVRTVLATSLTPTEDRLPSDAPFGQEVTFMSSGTSERVKLCTYTGENFYYQVCSSVDIIRNCPAIKAHYDGQLKHLVLLPFCHVFGFMAVYLWFGFFSRTFVFPRNLDPSTVQNTVKKHKVTHIFAVPMVWEVVHKAAIRKIQARGEKTYRRFTCVSGLVNRLGRGGDFLAHRLLGEVRDGLFGDSVRFLISGGSHIDPETLTFFNGIGYHLANGYGMTEIGITSVESSSSRRVLNRGSVGAPFGMTEYRVSEDGELLVRGRNTAARIAVCDTVTVTDPKAWFATGDLAEESDGRYYIKGRRDDLIITADGENINPLLVESAIRVEGVERTCLYCDRTGHTVLLASLPGCYSVNALRTAREGLTQALSYLKLERTVTRLLFTREPLLRDGAIKVSRRQIARLVESGELSVFTAEDIEGHAEELLSDLENDVRACFSAVLGIPAEEIGVNDHFFTGMGGSSLEYFALQGELKARLGVELDYSRSRELFTVRDFILYIQSH